MFLKIFLNKFSSLFLVGYVTLTPTSYTVSEDVGYVDVGLELVGGVVATTVQVK